MDVVELRELLDWIEANIKARQIAPRYAALRDILQQNAQGGQQQPSESQKNDLLAAVGGVDLDRLSLQQQEMLDRAGIGPYVGQRAVDMIEDVLYRGGLDLPTAAQRMGDAAAAVEQGLGRLDQIGGGLEGLVDVVADRPESGVLIRVTFEREAGIRNVVELKDWSETWWHIARGIAMVHDQSPESVTVIGAGRGSLIVDLSVAALGIATILSAIIMKGLIVTEKVVDIKMKAEDLKTKRLINKKIVADLEKEAEEEKAAAADEIVKDIVKEQKIKTAERGDKVPALKKSVDLILDFLEKGGDVDLILPPGEEEAEEGEEEAKDGDGARRERNELRINVREIRRLEARVKMIGAGETPEE